MGRSKLERGAVSTAYLVLALGLCAPGACQPSSVFDVEELAEGVLLFRPTDAGGARTNSLVVERTDGLLVVEAQPTPRAAREFLGELARRSSEPVRYLVLSHPHSEAAGGASAFPESTLVIGAVGAVEALRDEQYDFGAEMRLRSEDPDAWTEPERRVPVLVLLGRTDLGDPLNPVELRPVRQSHSRGDLLVFLPRANLLYAGGVLFNESSPYAGDANVGHWLGLLNSICSESPGTIVALRGPAVQVAAVRGQRDALAWVRGQVEQGFVDQLSLEGIARRVLDNPGLAGHFDTGTSPSFLEGLVGQVVEESADQRRKRGRL